MWPLALSLALAAAPAEESDEYVEILESVGAIDGPAKSGAGVPNWERVRVELRVINRLSVDVGDLDLAIALVSASGKDTQNVIPGWSFRERLERTQIPASDRAFLRIERDLPARRTSPPADEIAYRVRIRAYRMFPPDLPTALRLLGSSRRADQRAALESYDSDFLTSERDRLGEELAIALASLPPEPTAADALRLMFAVRALGSLAVPGRVVDLLYLPDRLDRDRWGRAVLELAERMIDASQQDEPRLYVLPTWARNKSAFLKVRAEDALDDAVRDAILRMADVAVPPLLLQSHTAPEPSVRTRARRLLHTLGRSTVRSQLALRDRDARLDVVRVLGRIQKVEPVPALVELTKGRDAAITAAARASLQAIGAPAIEPLVEALGTPQDTTIRDALIALSTAHGAVMKEVATRYGVVPSRGEVAAETVERLRRHLKNERGARLVTEIDLALEDGRRGHHAAAFKRLDRVFAQDSKLYMRYAEPIARLYFESAEKLVERGDYDAAVETLRSGLSVQRTPRAEALLVEARLALVDGYVALGELKRASEVLDTVAEDADGRRRAEGQLLAARARKALAVGNLGRARTLLDRALLVRPDDADLILANRKLLMKENLAIVIVAALVFPALLLVGILFVRRRVESARVRRLAIEIDRGS